MDHSLTKIGTAAALVIGVLAAGTATRAGLIVEDFENGRNGGFSANPVFSHEIGLDVIAGGAFAWEFTNETSISAAHALRLFPGADFVTFNPPEGQFVDYVQVWMAASPLLPTAVYVRGLDELGDPLQVIFKSNPNDSWILVTSAGAGFSEIHEVWLTAMKIGLYDDLAIRVVPEPGTACLLAAGFVGLLKRRRRRRGRQHARPACSSLSVARQRESPPQVIHSPPPARRSGQCLR